MLTTSKRWVQSPVIAVLLCCMVFGGCTYVSPLPLDKLPDKSVLILPGQTDIESVHTTLGEPYIASRYWDFELFRDSAQQTGVPIPLFVPFAITKDDIHRYTLVTYDENGTAASVSTGILRKPPDRRSVSPLEYNYQTIHLKTPDLIFVSGWNIGADTLLALPQRRDAYLEQARSKSQATVVIGCGTRGCSDWLSIDDGPSLPLPCRLWVVDFAQKLPEDDPNKYEIPYPNVQYDTVAAITIAPGNHTLKAWGGRWTRGLQAGRYSGEQTIHFSCNPGEVLYIVIDIWAKEYDHWWGAKDIRWNIGVQHDMPEIFNDRPLVLYRADQWFADPEPQ